MGHELLRRQRMLAFVFPLLLVAAILRTPRVLFEWTGGWRIAPLFTTADLWLWVGAFAAAIVAERRARSR